MAATIIAAVFLSFETVQSGTSIPTLPKNLLPPTITIFIPYSSTDPFCDTQGISGGSSFRGCQTLPLDYYGHVCETITRYGVGCQPAAIFVNHHRISVMELGHLLTRSGLTYL